MRVFLIVGGVAALSAFIYFNTSSQSSPAAGTHPFTIGQERTSAPTALPLANPEQLSPLKPLQPEPEALAQAPVPHALQGTRVPGSFRTDLHGNLIVDHEVRSIFDYHLQLLGTGKYDADSVKAMIEALIAKQLHGDAADQAIELLDRYVSFYEDRDGRMLTEELVQQKMQFTGSYESKSLAMIEEYYSAMDELKTNYFSEDERTAFFKDDEYYENYMRQRLAIGANAHSTEQAQAALAELDQNNSDSFHQQRQQTFALDSIKATMRSEQDSYNKRYALEAQFGEEKAERILAVENARAQWNEKKQQYYALKSKVAQEYQQYDAQQRQNVLNAMMRVELGFTDTEIKRMRMLEGLN